MEGSNDARSGPSAKAAYAAFFEALNAEISAQPPRNRCLPRDLATYVAGVLTVFEDYFADDAAADRRTALWAIFAHMSDRVRLLEDSHRGEAWEAWLALQTALAHDLPGGGNVRADSAELRRDLQRAVERIASLEQAREELRARITELEVALAKEQGRSEAYASTQHQLAQAKQPLVSLFSHNSIGSKNQDSSLASGNTAKAGVAEATVQTEVSARAELTAVALKPAFETLDTPETPEAVRTGLRSVRTAFAALFDRLGRNPPAGSASAALLARREPTFDIPAPSPDGFEASTAAPPPDFDMDVVKALILRGERVPARFVPYIETLDFAGEERLHDLSPLADLTALERLTLLGARVSDLSPLAGLTALRDLDLSITHVSDLTPLAGLSELKELALNGTYVGDVSPLSRLTGLRALFLHHTKVSDLSPLADLPVLQVLEVGRTEIRDLSPLAGLAALQFLDLHGTGVSNLQPLAGLTALETLLLDHTAVADLTPLAGLPSLTELSIADTDINDMLPLFHIPHLTFLRVDRRQKKHANVLQTRKLIKINVVH